MNFAESYLQHDLLIRIALHTTLSLPEGFPNISSMLEGFHDISLAMRDPLYDHWRIELHETLRSSPPNGFSNPSLSGGLSRYELRREGSSHCIAHNTLSTRGVSNPCLMLKAFHDTSLTMKGLQHYLLRIVLHTQPLVRYKLRFPMSGCFHDLSLDMNALQYLCPRCIACNPLSAIEGFPKRFSMPIMASTIL